MTVKIAEAAKRCEITITGAESSTLEVRETIRRYQARGYRVCVLTGDERPHNHYTAALSAGHGL